MKIFPIDNKKFMRLLDIMPPLSITDGPWIAGGAVRKIYQNKSWETGDIDIFFKNEEQRKYWNANLIDTLCAKNINYNLKHQSSNADTWEIYFKDRNLKIQFIKKYYCQSLIELWNTFDFTVCQFAADSANIIASDAAINDSSNNQIVIANKNNSRCIPLRILKYLSHGFSISDEILLLAAEKIKTGELDWENEY